MKIVKPSVELLHTGYETDIQTPEQLIERIGRTCYKSEDRITAASAQTFVANLVKRGHEAMIEHFSPIFWAEPETYDDFVEHWEMLLHNGNLKMEDRLRPFLRFTDWTTETGVQRCIISGNMRAWRDYAKACMEAFGWLPAYLYSPITLFPTFFPEYTDWKPEVGSDDILRQIGVDQLMGELEHGIHHDVTAKFICDRGVTHEMVRHRTSSFAQESTRYCNYSLGKFEGSITIVEPQFISEARSNGRQDIIDIWTASCERAEQDYLQLLDLGCSPQEARCVLPTDLKAEIIMTTNLYGWDHFTGLRCASDAQPDMRASALMLLNDLDEKVYPYV